MNSTIIKNYHFGVKNAIAGTRQIREKAFAFEVAKFSPDINQDNKPNVVKVNKRYACCHTTSFDFPIKSE